MNQDTTMPARIPKDAGPDTGAPPDGAGPKRTVPVEPGDEGLGLTDLLRDSLERRASEDDPTPWKHRLITRLLVKADDGDLKAIQEIWARLEGKPGQAGSEPPGNGRLTQDVQWKLLRAVGDGREHEDEGQDDEDDDGDGAEAEDAGG